MWFRKFSIVAVLLQAVFGAAEYSNPLRSSNGGDPSIVFHDGWYYLMSTKWSYLEMTRSTTLEGLKNGETKQVWSDTDPSRCCNVWAPEMHNVDGSWHIYYSAGNSGGDQRPQVLRGGATPWDAYEFLGTINTPSWAIDGTLLTIDNVDYFVYSCFSSSTGERLQSLCIGEMTSRYQIKEERVLASPTAQWERSRNPVNEGPFALYRNGKIFLSFSASDCWTADYQLGLLTYNGGDPLNSTSWTKTGPVFSKANGNFGTGHNSFFTSPDGTETWMAYHSTPNSAGSCGDRYANAKKIDWNSDGTPDFGQAPAYGQMLASPAGEI